MRMQASDANLEMIQMKSMVQTYDIRDSTEYKGVFEIEVLLQSLPEREKIGLNVTEEIRNRFKKTADSEVKQ